MNVFVILWLYDFFVTLSFILEQIDVKEGDRVTEHIYLCKIT